MRTMSTRAGLSIVAVLAIVVLAVGPTAASAQSAPQALPPPGPPIGNLDMVRPFADHIEVGGWAIDPDGPDAMIDVVVYVDSASIVLLASWTRGDVGNHGFGASLGATLGPHRVCAYARNIGVGADAPIGCETVYVAPEPATVGALDSATVTHTNMVTVRGWALDPGVTEPAPVGLVIDTGFATPTPVVADTYRQDVGQAFPSSGPDHGFGAEIPLPPGRVHRVCAVTPVGSKVLGCRYIDTALGAPPIGSLDTLVAGTASVVVSGWSIDPDTDVVDPGPPLRRRPDAGRPRRSGPP